MAANLTAKAGPLPVYAWGGIVGVSVLGYVYVQHRRAKSVAVVTAPVDALGNTAGGLSAFDPGGVGSGGAVPVLGPGSVSASPNPTLPLFDPNNAPQAPTNTAGFWGLFDPTQFVIAPIDPVVTPIGAVPPTTPPVTLPIVTAVPPSAPLSGDPLTPVVLPPLRSPVPVPAGPAPAPGPAPVGARVPVGPVVSRPRAPVTPMPRSLTNAQAYALLARHYNHPVDAAWLQSVFHHPVDNAWLNGIAHNPPPLPGR